MMGSGLARMRRLAWIWVQGLALASGLLPAWAQPPVFVEKPYLQLGSAATQPESLAVLWHGPDQDGAWVVAVRAGRGAPWSPGVRPSWVRVAVPTVPAHRVYSALLRPPRP